MSNKNKPHPHAELIKAWADGATIQYRVNDETDCWEDCNPNPGWCEFHEYRVKPEENEPWKPKEGISYLFVNSCGHVDFKLWESNTLDERHYKIGNCFHLQSAAEAAAERVKAALKGEDTVEQALKDGVVVARKVEVQLHKEIAALERENTKPCVQLDGKPLTDGEKELIKALRLADIRSVIPFENIAIYTNVHGELCNDEATIAFTVWSSNELIRAALEQIQAEQEETDE